MPARTHKVRSDCKYNQNELDEILPYKLDFINGTIPERMQLLKGEILPKLFNYWESLGKVYNSIESKIISKVILSKLQVCDNLTMYLSKL